MARAVPVSRGGRPQSRSSTFGVMKCSYIGEAARCDLVIARILDVSRNEAQRMIRRGLVALDGQAADKGLVVHPRQALAVDLAGRLLQPDSRVVPKIVYRSADYLVIDKPVGLPVLPSANPGSAGDAEDPVGSVLAGLAAHEPGPWISLASTDHAAVHRLDTATSGLVLFARSQAACVAARNQWHGATKIYEALVPTSFRAFGEQAMHLKVRQHRPARVAQANPSDPRARHCSMTIDPIGDVIDVPGVGSAARRIRIALDTGFLHQIRAMCAAWETPIVGDEAYGGAPAERMMLHAGRLRLPSLSIDATSPVPF